MTNKATVQGPIHTANGNHHRAGSAPPSRNNYDESTTNANANKNTNKASPRLPPSSSNKKNNISKHRSTLSASVIPQSNPKLHQETISQGNGSSSHPKRSRENASSSALESHNNTNRNDSSPSSSASLLSSLSHSCSMAMSRTESILVSASGDVLVCRCRRSSTPYISKRQRNAQATSLDPWMTAFCCDMEALPWSPVFSSHNRNNDQRTSHNVRMGISSSQSQTSEGSAYEWETQQQSSSRLPLHRQSSVASSNASKYLLTKPTTTKTGSTETPKENGVDNSHSSVARIQQRGSSTTASTSASKETTPSRPLTLANVQDFNAYDGGILPMPSFDYSHIHEGMNDMVVTSTEERKKRMNKQQQPPQRITTIPEHAHIGSGTMTSAGSRRSKASTAATAASVAGSFTSSPQQHKKRATTASSMTFDNTDEEEGAPFYHGVPTFLPALSQIKIRQVSANPLGAHVLMISAEALLFTYGLNHHGQLGIGIKSHLKDATRGFHITPTLITPLLENGGKAIRCAAGVDHSLVLVATEGRRLQKLVHTNPHVAHSEMGGRPNSEGGGSNTSTTQHDDDGNTSHHSNDSTAPDDSNKNPSKTRYHQLYGFGSNACMKIGLINATLADDGRDDCDVEQQDVVLPRRVALHCTVWPDHTSSSKQQDDPFGIVDIAASSEHSAALVRRPTGDVECYMWGNATVGALGLPNVPNDDHPMPPDVLHRSNSNAKNIFPLPTVLERLSFRPQSPNPLGYPTQLALGPYCSLVVMSSGKCMSFGFSPDGMLGLGFGETHTMEPKQVFLPNEDVVSISAGASHAIAITARGDAYSWGVNADDRLGLGTSDFVTKSSPKGETDGSVSPELTLMMEWVPQKIDLDTRKSSSDGSLSVIRACAGYDSSLLVDKSGRVFGFGKRSGRLGRGDCRANTVKPEPLHGGLKLFHEATTISSSKSGGSAGNSNADPTHQDTRPKPLRRMQSESRISGR